MVFCLDLDPVSIFKFYVDLILSHYSFDLDLDLTSNSLRTGLDSILASPGLGLVSGVLDCSST